MGAGATTPQEPEHSRILFPIDPEPGLKGGCRIETDELKTRKKPVD
jgi:hypothetical protein